MAKTFKIQSPLALFLERKGVIPAIVGSYFNNWLPSAGENVNCPWHEDTRASLHISLQGQAHCFGCRECAKDIIELVAKLEGMDYEAAGKLLYQQILDPIPEGRVQVYEKNLWRDEKALEYLSITRNLTDKTVRDYRLGLDHKDNRIIIPVFDQFNGCVNIRRMGWQKEHEKKALNKKGQGDARLYPENKLLYERRVLMVEGEFDCLVGRAFDLPAITWTCGANSWNENHQHLLQDKAVFLLYDNDRAGREATAMVVEKLKGIAFHVEACPPLCHDKGKDLTDWSFTEVSEIHKLRTHIKDFKFPKVATSKHFCPYCHQEMKGVT